MKTIGLAALLVALAPVAQAQDTSCSGVMGSGLFTMNCTTTQPLQVPAGPPIKRGELPWYDDETDKAMERMGFIKRIKVWAPGIETIEWDYDPKPR